MPELHETYTGQMFFKNTLPSLIQAINGLTQELKRYNDNTLLQPNPNKYSICINPECLENIPYLVTKCPYCGADQGVEYLKEDF